MSRSARLLLVLALCVLGAYYVASPYVMLYRVRAAAQSGDASLVIAHVDFPALRSNLKTELSVRIISEAEKLPADDPAVAQITRIALQAGDAMIDKMVTPDAIILMLHEKGRGAGSKASEAQNLSRSYRDMNTFVVSVMLDQTGFPGTGHNDSTKAGPEPVRLVFKRQALFSWKLTAFELPPLAP